MKLVAQVTASRKISEKRNEIKENERSPERLKIPAAKTRTARQ